MMPYTINTHPAAAIALKSASVIHVFQCSTNFDCATLRSWSCAKVHSSTMAGLPVFLNKLGFINGCMTSVIEVSMHDRRGGDGQQRTSRTSQPPRLTPRTFLEP